MPRRGVATVSSSEREQPCATERAWRTKGNERTQHNKDEANKPVVCSGMMGSSEVSDSSTQSGAKICRRSAPHAAQTPKGRNERVVSNTHKQAAT
jgi:hypothetical protein